MIILTVPENKWERRGRSVGWCFVPMEETEKEQVRQLCGSLKDKGVTDVYFSDFNSTAGNIVGEELGASRHQDYSLRRFNIGRNHKAKSNHVFCIFDKLVEQWKGNDAIPIRGGDSWKSVQKRLLAEVAKLVAKPESVVFVTDAATATLAVYQTPKALVMNGTGLKPGKIYQVAS